MPDYDIYAIGAALVDTEVEVTDSFLAKHAIDKGVMTLVEQSRQAQLVDSLNQNGSKLFKQSGGSACNSVVAAAQLGSKTYFGGKLANDDDGKLYADDLTEGRGFTCLLRQQSRVLPENVWSWSPQMLSEP
jgi:sugar/nucleoside kinase (ribokinase family)